MTNFNLSEKMEKFNDDRYPESIKVIDVKEFIDKQVIEGFNNLAENLPQEGNHNFSRENIQALIKNQLLIIKKRLGDKFK